jgi:hypothetical protein
MPVTRAPDDQPHKNWRQAIADLLDRNVEDVVGYVVIAALKDHLIVLDTNSRDSEGVLILLEEARKLVTKEEPNGVQADV